MVTSACHGRRYARAVRKTREFPNTRIDVETARRGIEELRAALEPYGETDAWSISFDILSIWKGQDKEKWAHDDIEDFYADLGKSLSFAHLRAVGSVGSGPDGRVVIEFSQVGRKLDVEVTHPRRAVIERVMRVFENAAPLLQLDTPAPEPQPEPRVFIGHGGASQQWRLLKDHLSEQHGYDVVAYETGARAGHTIRDVLDDLLENSSFALLVFTGEDAQADGGVRARQNVVHEAGLFQGRLGFSRAVILLEEGVENLSNLDGIQYISFSRNNVREGFGDVLATLRREFGPPSR